MKIIIIIQRIISADTFNKFETVSHLISRHLIHTQKQVSEMLEWEFSRLPIANNSVIISYLSMDIPHHWQLINWMTRSRPRATRDFDHCIVAWRPPTYEKLCRIHDGRCVAMVPFERRRQFSCRADGMTWLVDARATWTFTTRAIAAAVMWFGRNLALGWTAADSETGTRRT